MTTNVVELRASPAEEVRQAVEAAGGPTFFFEGCDQALLGVAEHPSFGTRAAYLGEPLLALLCERRGISPFEAQEFLDMTVRDWGEDAPVIVWVTIL